jgi:hypothetical protein
MVKFCRTRVTLADFAIDPVVPVTVRLEFPPAVDGAVVTVRVDVPAPVMVAGLKLAVAPAGSPVTLGVTVPLNPFSAVVVTVYVALPPPTTVCVAGVTANVKSTTLKVTLVVCASVPFVPVIVSVEFAAGVVPEVVTVRVDVPAPVIVAGLKLAVAPAGNPVTVGVTVPLNPLTAVVLTV